MSVWIENSTSYSWSGAEVVQGKDNLSVLEAKGPLKMLNIDLK